MRLFVRWLGIVVAPLALIACGGSTVQETFGIARRPPDEFQVVRRAPLIIPPDYRLRPPQPGSEGPRATTPSAEAYAALTGRPPPMDRTLSPAERALVQAAPGEAIPNIRQVIAGEGPQLAILDRGTFLFILSWQERPYQEALARREVLDPSLEVQRLKGEGIVQTTRTASVPLAP